MDNRGPKVNGKVKGGPHGRTFDVKTRPISEIFIKTDWSKDGIGSVLLQAYDSGESRKLESQ